MLGCRTGVTSYPDLLTLPFSVCSDGWIKNSVNKVDCFSDRYHYAGNSGGSQGNRLKKLHTSKLIEQWFSGTFFVSTNNSPRIIINHDNQSRLVFFFSHCLLLKCTFLEVIFGTIRNCLSLLKLSAERYVTYIMLIFLSSFLVIREL